MYINFFKTVFSFTAVKLRKDYKETKKISITEKYPERRLIFFLDCQP